MVTRQELNAMIQKYVQGVLAQHKPDLAEYLSTGANPSMSADEVCGVMIGNCLDLSVQLSVQITAAVLSELGVLALRPDPPGEGLPPEQEPEPGAAPAWNGAASWSVIEGGLSKEPPEILG